MGNFIKTQSVLDNQFVYTNSSLEVSGNYFLDAPTSTFKNISGSIFSVDTEGNQGDFICGFSGSMIEGKMSYSFSQMTEEQYQLVWVAVKELEPYILGENN